eukprot:scaffold25710_cov32-Tisochrysis_lutea.AAC.1
MRRDRPTEPPPTRAAETERTNQTTFKNDEEGRRKSALSNSECSRESLELIPPAENLDGEYSEGGSKYGEFVRCMWLALL